MSDGPREQGGGRSITSDRVLGAIGGLMIAAALALLLFGGASDGGAEPTPPPPIELLSPGHGVELPMPLEIHFTTEGVLSRGPGGWSVGSYHLHASIDGLEVMPGPDDLRAAGGEGYVWTIAGLAPGEREVRLFWSDEQHVPVEGAGSAPVIVRLREGGR